MLQIKPYAVLTLLLLVHATYTHGRRKVLFQGGSTSALKNFFLGAGAKVVNLFFLLETKRGLNPPAPMRTYRCYSDRPSRLWCYAHSTPRRPRGCNNTQHMNVEYDFVQKDLFHTNLPSKTHATAPLSCTAQNWRAHATEPWSLSLSLSPSCLLLTSPLEDRWRSWSSTSIRWSGRTGGHRRLLIIAGSGAASFARNEKKTSRKWAAVRGTWFSVCGAIHETRPLLLAESNILNWRFSYKIKFWEVENFGFGKKWPTKSTIWKLAATNRSVTTIQRHHYRKRAPTSSPRNVWYHW